MSWGNSFGYLVPADTARSLAGMHAALRPGGRLVLESVTVAETYLTGGVKPSAEWEHGGVRLTAENHYRVSESRLESEFTFEDADGHVERGRAAHHVHTSGEVVRLLRQAGFGEVERPGRRRRRALRGRLAAARSRSRDVSLTVPGRPRPIPCPVPTVTEESQF